MSNVHRENRQGVRNAETVGFRTHENSSRLRLVPMPIRRSAKAGSQAHGRVNTLGALQAVDTHSRPCSRFLGLDSARPGTSSATPAIVAEIQREGGCCAPRALSPRPSCVGPRSSSKRPTNRPKRLRRLLDVDRARCLHYRCCFARQTHSRKQLRITAAMADLYFMRYHFGRVHRTLRVTPAMEAGRADQCPASKEIRSLRGFPESTCARPAAAPGG